MSGQGRKEVEGRGLCSQRSRMPTTRGQCWHQTVGLSGKNVKREPGRGRQVDSIIDFSLVYFQYRLSSDLMRQLLSVLPVERGGGWGGG